MTILAIETSCDETAIAIIETDDIASPTTIHVLADVTLSQIALHKEYGGVFPMLAKREHARALVPLLVRTLKEAGLYKETSRHVIESPLRKEFQDILDREPELFAQFINILPNIDPPAIDMIAVTEGPGLEPALWVGINFAKALSLVWKKPILPINHMEGHLLAGIAQREGSNIMLPALAFPALGLLVSGGHTELVLMRGPGDYEIIGETKDDAVGEAFDKVARILGLPYPGGPEIARLATLGHSGVYPLPRPMLHTDDYDFSFSGLKTAVLYLVKKMGVLSNEQKADIAREFEEACAQVLVTKTLRAAEEFGAQSIIVGGGVSANTRLRTVLADALARDFPEIVLHIPHHALSTDNALMIAIAAACSGKETQSDLAQITARGNLRIA